MFIILDDIRVNTNHIEEYEIDGSGCLVIEYYSGRTRRFPPEFSGEFFIRLSKALEADYVRR
jgi:hypothetical protein